MKDAGGGPWEGCIGLVEAEKIRQLEEQQDVVYDLVGRLEGRQQEMERMEDFSEGEQSQEEEPHNNGFISHKDDGPRKSWAEMDDQASARREKYRVGRPGGGW